MIAQPQLFSDAASGAWFSPCRKFRYALWRGTVDLQPFCGFNPSRAAELDDDHTIRKERKFARLWGAGGIYKVNLLGFCATDPADLRAHEGDAAGIGNARAWSRALRICAETQRPMVVAWGRIAHPQRDWQIEWFCSLAKQWAVPLVCLGKNQDGSPRHPLMLSYATQLEAWP